MIGSSEIDKDKSTRIPKNWYVLGMAMILVFPVFLDLLNGFLIYKMNMTSPILTIYRGTISLASVPVLLLIKDKRHVIWLLVVIGLFFVNIAAWSVFKTLVIGTEVALFVKLIYPYLILGIGLLFLERKWLKLSDLTNLQIAYCTIAAISIIASFAFGVGIEYGGSKHSFGTKSFFSAQNDISLALLIGYVLNGGMLLTTLKKRYFVFGLLIFLALVALSTRSGIIGAFGVTGVLIALTVVSGGNQVNIYRYKKNILFVTMTAVMVVFGIVIANVISEYHYMITKFESLSVEQPRELLINAGKSRLDDRPTAMNVFGEGSSSFMKKVGFEVVGLRRSKEEGKTVEVDYMDLIGNYGIPFTILLLAFPFWVLISGGFHIVLEGGVWNTLFTLAMVMFLGHSFLAGHAMMSPLVGTAMIPVYLSALRRPSIIQRLGK
ncbi:MAG: hypothetical protein ACI85F_001147 [Bacteroidia bacterium]|jgi:hypothetical protein